MMNVLIVDGYNIIGDWEELKKLKDLDMGQARDRLIELMADYQAYSGSKVIIVFDAYFVKGNESVQKAYKIEILFTKENETADECIERIITHYKHVDNQVYVATSDHLEQRVIFGRGALRKSARELFIEVKDIEKEIGEKLTFHQKTRPQAKISLNKDVLAVFEEWRRRKK